MFTTLKLELELVRYIATIIKKQKIMKTKEKQLTTLTATFIFAALVMGLIVYGLAKENDNMRRKIDYLEYVLRECE